MASGKKKKKNMVTLLSLFALLLLLVVAYMAVTKWKEKEENQDDADNVQDGVQLAAVETVQIEKLSVENDLYSYVAEYADGVWALKGDAEFPLNMSKLDAMAEQLADLRASRLVLTGAEDLGEYGLLGTAMQVTVEKTDKTQVGLLLGDRSGADGGYYACVAGTSDVYLVEENVRDCFYNSKTELMNLDTVPTFASEKATGLKVSGERYPAFTIKDSTGDLKDLTAMALYTLALYEKYEKPVRVDLTNFAALMENYTAISLGEFVSYHAADLEGYGLLKPVDALTVWYTESGEDGTEQQKEFTVFFGNRTEDGSKVYVRLEGSNQSFLMPAETQETLLAADTFSAISVYTQMVNITTISKIDATYAGTKRIFEMTHETVETDSGSTSTKDHFTVDGKALDDEEESGAFRDLYQAIIGVRLTGELLQGAEPGTDAVLSLTFYDNDGGQMHQVRYLPVVGDQEHYAIEENGTCLFMTDATLVDTVVEQLKEYQP